MFRFDFRIYSSDTSRVRRRGWLARRLAWEKVSVTRKRLSVIDTNEKNEKTVSLNYYKMARQMLFPHITPESLHFGLCSWPMFSLSLGSL